MFNLNVNPDPEGCPIRFSIPAHFSEPVVGELVRSQKPHCARAIVDEAYGCLSRSLLGHGRSPGSVAAVDSFRDVRKYCDEIRKHGVVFNYLMNAPYSGTKVPKDDAMQHIAEMIESARPDVVTVSSLEIATMVREIDPEMEITISTIAGIRRPEQLIPYLKVEPQTVVPHHDLGKSLDELGALSKFANAEGVDIRLLVNESCLHDCPRRHLHYEYLASGQRDDFFQGWCNQLKYENPALWLESGWIRPEDISMFRSRYGIQQFKISGRAKPASWLVEVVSTYIRGGYSGNLVRLLATTPPWTDEPWNEMSVDNEALHGFLEGLPANREEKRRYCEEWVNRLSIREKLTVKMSGSEGRKQNIAI